MPLLEVRNLIKSFGGLVAVKNVSFDVDRGEIVGMIGPNGSGKTTIFNIICGFYKPDAGAIRFKGEDIAALSPNRICRKGIGRTFQIVMPFQSMAVMQNLLVGATYSKRVDKGEIENKCIEVLKLTGLYEKRDVTLSSLTLIERRRVELARALATNPDLILLDEVMAGLTPAEVDAHLGIIRSVRDSGITVLLVEHIMRAVIKASDRIIVLNYGEKIAEGKPQDIVEHKEVIKAYFGTEKVA